MIETGVILGIIAMFGFGLNNALSKIPTKNLGAIKAIFYRQLFVLCFLLPCILLFSITLTAKHLIIAFALSIVGYIAIVAFFKAIEVGKMGIIAPVANSSVIYTVIFSLLFFDEVVGPKEAMAISCIIAGIILISINFSDLKRSHLFDMGSGILLALITSIGWGLLFAFMKIPVTMLGPILTAVIIEGSIAIYTGLQLKVNHRSLEINKKMLLYLVLVGLFGAVGLVFFNLGIKFSDVSLVAAITFSNPLVSTLYARFVYKEELTIQQWIAAIAIVVGIATLSYF